MASIIIGYTGRLLDPRDGTTTIGVKGVGKDTSADIMQELQAFAGHDSVRLSFASPLKDILCDMYELDRSVWDTPERKESLIPGLGWTFRRLCEVFGTNVVRDRLGQVVPNSRQIWVDLVLHQIATYQKSALEKATAKMCGYQPMSLNDETLVQTVEAAMAQEQMPPVPKSRPVLIQVTDVRYYNEYEALKAQGAIIVCVQRRAHATAPGPSGPNGLMQHPSNVYDERMVPDYIVDNNGTKDELHQRLDGVASLLSTSARRQH